MKEFPTIERSIWTRPKPIHVQFESAIAAHNLTFDRLFDLIDVPCFFERIDSPLPKDEHQILQVLADSELITAADSSYWNITNAGAILLAINLQDFQTLKHKAARLIQYQDNKRVEIELKRTLSKGYANGFEELISLVIDSLSKAKGPGKGSGKKKPVWPELALRELIANALIHQEYSTPDSGPLIEIFDDRIEMVNSGLPLVNKQRLVNSPPKTRNHKILSMMRQMNLATETGCGWDRIVAEAERCSIPAPIPEIDEDTTRVVMLSPRALTDMDYSTRIWSVYQHACLKFVNREHLTNGSLRQRFGIELKNSAIASRLIKEAVEAKVIVPYQAEIGRKHMRYVPFWADSNQNEFI